MTNYRWLAPLLFLPLVQCQDNSITGPGIPEEIRATAIRLRVDLSARTVSQVSVSPGGDVRLSLVGSDGVSVETSNYIQSPLGKNKISVKFDVAITNLLNGVTLVHPTSPVPPAGTSGILLFPAQATTTGGTGSVDVSTDWDGEPFDFLSNGTCRRSATNCYRWEEFPSPLAPDATTAARTVGFETDKTVTTFDVVMFVVADLQNVATAPPAISLSQTSANFQWTSGALSPSNVSVVVANSGGGTLTGLTSTVNYQAGQPTDWLVASLSGTTAPATLSLTPALTAAMTDGTYNATVDVASDGVSNSPQTVTVTFVVSGVPASTAIYVSESDPGAVNDATCGLGPVGSGSGNHPCESIGFGLSRAVTTGRSEVRVADGRYTEAVTLANGKNLLGGYNPDTWLRHLSTTNTIIDGVSSTGNHDRTVIAANITSPTVFEGFVVRGATNTKTGGNSYAIYVASSSANLAIRNNAIYGGVGGPGGAGSMAAAAASGANGIGRSSNLPGYDSKIATGDGPCNSSNNRSYTNGGAATVSGDNISGGNGGGNICPPSSTFEQQSAQNGSIGFAGEGAAGGAAGTAGIGGRDYRFENPASGAVCYVSPSGTHVGGNGGAGGNGTHGAAVPGATDAIGSVSGSHWIGDPGTAGESGGNGGGGGGGGAGGGAYAIAPTDGKDRLGGVGGGGGAGGAGGAGGGAGSAGGGSFGIFIVGAAPVVTNNTIVQGTGGSGGAGGSAAAGGFGGVGGEGGQAAVFCTEAGGRGGDGGKGGTGSGGGGGAGGASFGIFTSGAGTPAYCTTDNNAISGGSGGSGGQGGASPVSPGGSGVTGARATCSFH